MGVRADRRRTTPGAHGVVDVDQQVLEIVSTFGEAVAPPLRGRLGSKEDHLRAPVVELLRSVGRIVGLDVVCYGEARLPRLSIRPDFLVEAAHASVGYVELKAPGRGVPGKWQRPSIHDRRQWEKLKALPNLLYTDGTHWALYRAGALHGEVARLNGDLAEAGASLRPADGEFARILSDFLRWEPESPRNIGQLVSAVAGLCRLLRSEVSESIARERSGLSEERIFTDLAEDWRELLFPDLKDDVFADYFAQTLTFALLLARVEGISFIGRSVPQIARQLTKKHSLMGRALEVLTHQTDESRSVAAETLRRVIGVVDWDALRGDARETYPYLYERFLEAYDPGLRRRSGSYYTPPQVVEFMVRFVDDLLRTRLGRNRGFASPDVFTVDPAMGTGTFLEGIVRTVAADVIEEEGPGQVAPRLRTLMRRLIGFENQAAPFAVAELRLHRTLKVEFSTEVPAREFRFLADTLADPDPRQLSLGSLYRTIRANRDEADRIKREVPVMVVIGNPPYRDKAGGHGGWIEAGSFGARGTKPLDAFRSSAAGRYEYLLSSMAVYFWRWATWKVFDAHPDNPVGIIAFITPSAYVDGRGFAGMREYLRRQSDEGWIIDLTPEGHRANQGTRVFRGVQQPLCIGIFLRYRLVDTEHSASVHFLSVAGSRAEKFDRLRVLDLKDPEWSECETGWTAPLRPPNTGAMAALPPLGELMPWSSRGVTAGRTWVIAPDQETLTRRWEEFIRADSQERRVLLPDVRDRSVDAKVGPLPGVASRTVTLADEHGPMAPPQRYAYRAFDRQWIIPDNRLLTVPRPALWAARSPRQIFLSEQDTQPLRGGPGLVVESHLPDLDHFMGHHGGRVLPLYRDPEGSEPNLAPGLLPLLSRQLDIEVTPEDFIAYIAAIVCHPSYTNMLGSTSRGSDVRVALTKDPALWVDGVNLGREVIWVHTYGERCIDREVGRPPGVPRLEKSRRPRVVIGVPDSVEGLPDRIWYESATETLCVGDGRIAPVASEVWRYSVSGMDIVRKWFEHRGRVTPRRPRTSSLDAFRPARWTDETTGELLDLLNVLGRCVLLEPRQSALLDRASSSDLITTEELNRLHVLPPSPALRKPRKPDRWPGQQRLWP